MGLFAEQTDYFGLDIGASSIRVVQLKKSGSKPALVTYGHMELPLGLSTSDAPADITKVAAAVKKLVKDAHISTKNVIAGLPSSKVFASVITTPKLGEHDLAKAINLQADQYIPMSTKDVKLDWYVIGPGKTPAEQEVLLVAAPNNVTEKLLSVCEQAGLDLIALEPNAVALARAVVQPSDLAVVVLDIGTTYSDITIVQANVPKLLRSVAVGSQTMTKTVEGALGLDTAQADQFVRKFGLTQSKLEGQVLKALKPILDQLTSEIDKSIKFFASQYPSIQLEKIVLTGGATSIPELPTYVANAAKLPVEIANAWLKISYHAELQDTLMGLSTQYGVAAGLAERDALV